MHSGTTNFVFLVFFSATTIVFCSPIAISDQLQHHLNKRVTAELKFEGCYGDTTNGVLQSATKFFFMKIPTIDVSTSVQKEDLPSVQQRDHTVIAPIPFLFLNCIRLMKTKHLELMAHAAEHALGQGRINEKLPAKDMSVVEDQVHIQFTSQVKLMYSSSSFVMLLQMKLSGWDMTAEPCNVNVIHLVLCTKRWFVQHTKYMIDLNIIEFQQLAGR